MAIALTVLSALASTAGAATNTHVAVHVQAKLRIAGNVHISFRPTAPLPAGGYYYAAIVLKPYRHYTRSAPPPCATSSNMQRTDYGYPHRGRPVELALTPTPSHARHWCPGGHYIGAVYAVPQAPPCNSTYPCRAEPYKPHGPCFELQGGHRVCGMVMRPHVYAYPDGLPRPLASSTRIVGYFGVDF